MGVFAFEIKFHALMEYLYRLAVHAMTTCNDRLEIGTAMSKRGSRLRLVIKGGLNYGPPKQETSK